MAKPITDGPIQIMLKDPVREAVIGAAAGLGVSVSALVHVVLEDAIETEKLEAKYIAALQKRVESTRIASQP